MSFFVKPTPSPTPRSPQVKQISIIFAFFLVVMAVTQLYSFNEFVELLVSFNLPFGESLAYIFPPLLIIFEVFALPFLLRMRLSPAFRFVSMVSGWIVAAKWVFISIWVLFNTEALNVGILGNIEQLQLPPGWWAVCFSISLCILAVWASWGMWPFKLKK